MCNCNFDPVPNATSYDIQFRKAGAVNWETYPNYNWKATTPLPIRTRIYNVSSGDAVEWRVRANLSSGNSTDYVQGPTFMLF
jgi:hypothetical protein